MIPHWLQITLVCIGLLMVGGTLFIGVSLFIGEWKREQRDRRIARAVRRALEAK